MRPRNELQAKIASNIKKLRKEKGWTQDELAAQLDVKRAAIARYENCIRTPTALQLHRLAEVFEITVDELMYCPSGATTDALMK